MDNFIVKGGKKLINSGSRKANRVGKIFETGLGDDTLESIKELQNGD
ncbi:MAG: hypothetical protein AAF901_08740 [Bacteroidota bacterium]